jgi:C-terminal processing protease CtpA/Prc
MLLSVPRTTSTKILRGRKIHADPASSTASISKHEITSRDGKSAWSTGEVDVKSLLPIIKVRRVEVNSCAAVAGLRKGDIIIALDGKQVTWKSEKEAMKYLEEASRSHVVISVLRRDEKMEFVCGRKNSEDSAEGSAAK